MSHRTQITLEDAQYARLLAESRASGLGLAELVRRAVDKVYGGTHADEFLRALDESFGAWDGEHVDGAAYVDTLRGARADRIAEW